MTLWTKAFFASLVIGNLSVFVILFFTMKWTVMYAREWAHYTEFPRTT